MALHYNYLLKVVPTCFGVVVVTLVIFAVVLEHGNTSMAPPCAPIRYTLSEPSADHLILTQPGPPSNAITVPGLSWSLFEIHDYVTNVTSKRKLSMFWSSSTRMNLK